jgi:hypothetical protein
MDNTTAILLWVSGAATSVSLAAVAALARANSRLRRRLSASLGEVSDIRAKLDKTQDIIHGGERLAVWHWDGWFYKSDPSKKWAVTVKMRVVESSLDKPGLHRFEFISHSSPEQSDPWDTKKYQEYFYKDYGGGWLDTNGKKGFHWTTEMDPRTVRSLKLESLGITNDTETTRP